MDKITLDRIKTAHPSIVAELDEIYATICKRLTGNVVCRFAYVYRSDKEQNELYAIGRTKPGKIVTNAKAGESYHNYGLAVDIVLIINGKDASWNTKADFDMDGIADWFEVAAVFQQYGWEWGGHWIGVKNDPPHFQKTLGRSIAQLKQLPKDKNGYVILNS